MAGLLAPGRSGGVELRGSVLIEGQALSAIRRKTACVFQDFALLPWKTVRENAELPLLVAGIPAARRREKTAALLEEFGLGSFAALYPRQLSGGMKQRLALVRALTAEPDLLLMDEPFSSLDALSREEAQDFLLELRQKHPLTVVLVTHSIEETAYLADRVSVITGKNPGNLAALVDIGRQEDRSRSGTEFTRICADLRSRLGEKVPFRTPPPGG
jgi:NitT/TauT family transport system ATP-binding protein